MKNKLHLFLLIMLPCLYAMEVGADERNLVIADWDVRVDSVSGLDFTFSTGDGGAASPTVKIEVYDVCRSDWNARTSVGNFYPTSTVTGIDVDDSGCSTPGENNDVTLSFVDGLSGNTDIYTDNGDDTATVEFCAQIGLYESTTLVNYSELKMTTDINLLTNATTLTGYTVTDAGSFTDAGSSIVNFDGTLNAYFCNPTHKTPLVDDGSKTHQGAQINICLKIPNGQFEIKDVLDLTIKKAEGTPSMAILSGGTFTNEATYVAQKTCTDLSTSDTNICMITVLLKEAFYDYSAITLTGSGTVLLELGDAPASRRNLAQKGSFFTHSFMVEPIRLVEERDEQDEGFSVSSVVFYFIAFGVVVGAVISRILIYKESRGGEKQSNAATEDGSAASSLPPGIKTISFEGPSEEHDFNIERVEV